MTSQRRFVGVARPPQGVDPEPPRIVVDLSRSTTGPASSKGRARSRLYGTIAEHRRRLRRAALRRWEAVVWFTAATVAAGVVAFVVGTFRETIPDVQAGAFVAVTPAGSPSGGLPPGSATGLCIFEPCGRSQPSGKPTYLRIPAINVKTPLEDLVLDANRQLEPPKTYDRAGWWTQGVAPGDAGPAVIAGHVDSKAGAGVFFDLRTLRAGDTIEVDRGGQVVAFQVTEVEKYPKDAFPSDRVYRPTPGAELRLITCGGLFDEARLSYRDNIVVYAVLK